MQSSHKYFLSLVRLGIRHRAEAFSDPVNWNEVQALAERQGLAAVLVDGIEQLPDSQRPPKEFLLQWIGEVLQNYEYRYELYRRAIAELAGFYREHGLRMMILKGFTCSLDWPKPEHRPCGDIDIWQFGKQKEADELVAKGKGIKVDTSHHHHTVFNWRDFMVENHYDFVNVYAESSSAKLEKVFKKLGMDDTHSVDVYGERIYIPSANLHALFLVRHMLSHFAAAEISLRQVLDWAFFVEKHTKEIDWEWLLGIIDEYHMKEFLNIVNAICVDDLGFSSTLFPMIQFKPELKERIFSDILEPIYRSAEPEKLFPRLVYKINRWRGNAWKQKLCYRESGWERFCCGIWSKLLKPTSVWR